MNSTLFSRVFFFSLDHSIQNNREEKNGFFGAVLLSFIFLKKLISTSFTPLRLVVSAFHRYIRLELKSMRVEQELSVVSTARYGKNRTCGVFLVLLLSRNILTSGANGRPHKATINHYPKTGLLSAIDSLSIRTLWFGDISQGQLPKNCAHLNQMNSVYCCP